MAKAPITELTIRTWSPTRNGDPCIAMIAGLPMVFYGKTPMQAYRAANEWRQAESAKEARRAQNTATRLAAAKAARAAKNAQADA